MNLPRAAAPPRDPSFPVGHRRPTGSLRSPSSITEVKSRPWMPPDEGPEIKDFIQKETPQGEPRGVSTKRANAAAGSNTSQNHLFAPLECDSRDSVLSLKAQVKVLTPFPIFTGLRHRIRTGHSLLEVSGSADLMQPRVQEELNLEHTEGDGPGDFRSRRIRMDLLQNRGSVAEGRLGSSDL
ncbi:hypothetical protein P7K49_032349 [Saguinus oedipus]|uniref:Uncharacterized protein n=1 Tax=Saguinus oedipus TaxID=9490 RepID=A0ABQ9TY00_SAGOE|nr:hypothetical protein P7K49_032349 [Saguinus oedipus]